MIKKLLLFIAVVVFAVSGRADAVGRPIVLDGSTTVFLLPNLLLPGLQKNMVFQLL